MINRFAKHKTAANLLLALMVICGFSAASQINRQFFPDFGIDVVTVTISWPGASASDVDQNIAQAIESAVRFLDGVKKVNTSSYEGSASATIEYESDHDMQLALSSVESAIGQIRTLPLDAERPEVSRVIRYETVSKLVVSGNFPEHSLQSYAEQIKDDLLALGIDRIDLFGDREQEIWVEFSPETLRRLDIKLQDVANRINESSQDLPAGELAGGERQVRSLGLVTQAREVREIEIKAFPDGRRLLLGDVSEVSESFRDHEMSALRNGLRAIELEIKRATNTDALNTSQIVRDYVKQSRTVFPQNLLLEEYDVRANSIKERIGLLLQNGLGGLLLVLIILFLFLNSRVAFWVALGIPVSLLATVAFMYASGQTINMISLFGMIMAIGIVVDDAIVVGEHAENLFRNGENALEAAVQGAKRMAVPVVSSTLTTVAAFLPLFMISGIIGQIISAIPFVVVAVLIASLIECFFILPAHLRYALSKPPSPSGLTKWRDNFDERFMSFRENRFRLFAKRAIEQRYITVAFAVASFFICVGAIVGGQVGYSFFPSPEPDRIYANLKMVPGTSREDTKDKLLEVEHSLYASLESMGKNKEDLVVMALGKIGTSYGSMGNSARNDTMGYIVVELSSSEKRNVRASDVLNAWRDSVEHYAGIESLTFEAARAGPPGGDMDIRLEGGSVYDLKRAANEVADLLARYPGIADIDDNLPYGKPEIVLKVNKKGEALGFNTSEVARQVRNSIGGAVAKRFPRDGEEVWVRVQIERELVANSILENLYLRASNGSEVPLKSVVDISESTGFARIKRQDGLRQISVTASVDSDVTRPSRVHAALLRDGLQGIIDKYHLQFEFAGRAEEQRETNSDMILGGVLGLSFIYIVLAWVFSSYARPLVVMAIIPLGLVGSVIGHALWGLDLTILSIFAILGLSGIVINDSIVLVTTVERRLEQEELVDALVNSSCDRFRAVVLTSATTIGGLLPLLFETSLQAQFLIPMALTLVFGLAVTTFVVLLLVPSLIMIQGDIKIRLQQFIN